MLNYLWAGMILLGILYSAITGNLDILTDAILDSSKDAITLAITMTGIMSFWVGIMRIAEKCGLISTTSKYLQPLIHFLFPDIPATHKSLQYISTNMIANFFGLGWAATPAGLMAMQELEKLRLTQTPHADKTPIATKEMCTFLVINISSLQLIPVNIIAYRSEYGSVAPSQIIGPAILATFFSTICAILFCKIVQKLFH